VPLYWIFISHTILMMIFCRAHTVVHTIFCLGSCLVGVGLVWTLSLFLHWSGIDEFVLGLKSVDELCHSPPMGIGIVRTLANRPRGRFAWTNHINFQITQPGSSTVTPLYKFRRLILKGLSGQIYIRSTWNWYYWIPGWKAFIFSFLCVGSACLLTDCVFSLLKGNFYQLWQSFNSISIWLCASEVNFSNGTPRVSDYLIKYNQKKHCK
jgi:hypothetical protein